MELNLNGKNAIIGGSSQGIGAAIAQKFASAGANLLLLARSEDKLKGIISSLPNNGKQLFDYSAVDFQNTEALRNYINQKIDIFGKFHIVVNNTGGPSPGQANKSSDNDFEKALRMHLIAYNTILQLVLDGMKSECFGRIINITSIGAKQPVDNLGVSNTIRGAVSAWAKTLSRELASLGITVNNILPGFIDTDRLRSLFINIAENSGITSDEVYMSKINEIPAGRLGNAEEIANAALFLASDKAAYINGINLPVDGGLLRTL